MTINFNKNFYNLESIKKTIRVYKKLADFDIKFTKKRVKVGLKNIDLESKKLIKHEFCNHVLGLMKNA